MRGLLALVVVVVAQGPAAAAPDRRAEAEALLKKGIALHREAAFAQSVAALEQARQLDVLSPEEDAECAFYLAADYVALGSAQAARREARRVLTLRPDYEPPLYTSPKVLALFREVRDELERAPRLRALPPVRREGRLELRFEASRTDGKPFGSAYWRWRGGSYREAPLAHAGEQLTAELPLDRNGTLEYWAEARGPAGLAQAASAERPLELPVTGVQVDAPARPRRGGVARNPWLWVGLGAVLIGAAGLATGLALALRPPPATAEAVLDFQVQ